MISEPITITEELWRVEGLGDLCCTNASLAFADGRICLRTDRHLYAIGSKP